MFSVTDSGSVFLGLDVHKASISAGVLGGGEDLPVVSRISSDAEAVRRLISRFPDRSALRCCYEAGPTGYGLARLLRSWGVSCEVIAPSLIPVASGDRVKTDRRDCRRLAELLRAGQLVAVRVPTEAEEGVRDLCRARTVLVTDVSRARHRLGSFLLRHGRVWPEPTASTWTLKHRAWVARQTFQDPAQRSTFDTYRALLMAREAELAGLEAQLQPWLEREPFVDAALRLGAYRGITRLGALAMAAEVGDWHRFGTAGGFAAFAGLTPSEYSSGDRIRRGHITRAGNGLLRTHLVESAWAYQHRPALGAAITRRQQGVPAQTCARAWKAQHYLCGKFRKLAARKDNQKIVVTAIARDLACFCWAEMNADRLT